MALRRLPVLLAALALSGSAPGLADVVTTKEGLVFEGAVTTAADGSVSVATEDGVARLEADRVAKIDAGEGPRARTRRALAALKAGDADAAYRLGLAADAAGLPDLAKKAYEAVLLADPDHPAARRALGFERVDGTWLPVPEARRRRGLVLYEGAWRLPIEAEAAARAAVPVPSGPDASLVEAMRTAAKADGAVSRAAALQVARADGKARLAAALALLQDPAPRARTWAAEHLAALGDESAIRPLLLSAVRDRDPDVRRAAVLAAGALGNDDVAVPLVKALGSEHPGLVANAAQALAVLGDKRAIGYVVKRISGHGSSPRVFVSFTNQVSYVRDYDVEIAQAANIANPVVGTVQEGVVLDVHVLDASIERTVVETYLVDAFNALSGAHALDAEGVLAWWRVHGAEVPDFPSRPARRAAGAAGASPR